MKTYGWLIACSLWLASCSMLQPSADSRLQRLDAAENLSLDERRQALQQLRSQHPEHPNVWLQSGVLALQAGDCDASVVAMKQALGLGQKDRRVYLGLGICADKELRHDEAQSYYRQGVVLHPDDWSLQNNLAYSRLLSGDVKSASRDLQSLASQYPYPAVRHNLALALAMQGQLEQAYDIEVELYGAEQASSNQQAYRRLMASGSVQE